MTDPDFTTATWRKSTHSGSAGECVELASASAAIGIRDSKNPAAPHLTVSRTALGRLIGGLKDQ
jgi:hypothetical protein